MSVVAAIRHVSERFGGHCLGMPDEILLRQQLPPEFCPEWLVEFLKSCPIIGTTIELSEEDDLSGQGAEMLWMPAHQIVDEMVNASPGREAAPLGYLAFGSCLIGSGDPYFMDLSKGSDDPPIIRIPHVAAVREPLDQGQIERVAVSLSELLLRSTVLYVPSLADAHR